MSGGRLFCCPATLSTNRTAMTKKEKQEAIEKKTWYRALKSFAVILVVVAFFAPLFADNSYTGAGWALDGAINAVGWLFLMAIGNQFLLYIVFGKQDN